jgi:hypothetical protein
MDRDQPGRGADLQEERRGEKPAAPDQPGSSLTRSLSASIMALPKPGRSAAVFCRFADIMEGTAAPSIASCGRMPESLVFVRQPIAVHDLFRKAAAPSKMNGGLL